MAKQTRDTLKSFYQTGDVPTESNYADLIDSNLNLSENNTGDIQLTGNITASGNVSASGTTHTLGSTLVGDSGISASNASGTHILGGDLTIGDDLTVNDDLIVIDDILIGGNGTEDTVLQRGASGELIVGSDFSLLGDNAGNTSILGLNHITASSDEIKIEATSNILNLVGNVTASNNISSSGIIFGRTGSFDSYTNANFGNSSITASAVSASGTITSNIITPTTITNVNTTHVTASGQISASGNISATGDLNIDGKSLFKGDITSSGIISASSVEAQSIAFQPGMFIRDDTITTSTNNIFFSKGIQIGTSTAHNITASANISASGVVTANRFDIDNNKFAAVNVQGSFDIGSTGSGSLRLTHVTASGTISASGGIIGNLLASNITASGPISSSGDIIANRFLSDTGKGHISVDSTNTHLGTNLGWTVGTNITASGNISASGNVFANSATVQGGLEVAMGGTSSDGIKILGGGGGTQAFLTNINGLRLQPTTQDPSQPDTPHVTIGVGGHITASGDISASGDIIANNINQSVKTTNSPTFASLILSDIAIDYRPTRDISGSLAYDATQTFNMGPKYGARLTVTGMPNVGADQLVTGIVVKNERVREHTIILANSNSAFTVQPFGIKSGQFVLNLRTGFKEYTASDFPSGFVINIALFGV